MRQQIKIKDFSIFFTNINKEMNLSGHSHFGLVSMTFDHNKTGFPAFGATYQDIKNELEQFTEKAFRESTNEEVARRLFSHFAELDYGKFNWPYETKFWLTSLTLSVRGVQDKWGHADGFADYTVSK